MRAFIVKEHNCDGSIKVFSPSEMYESLYYAYLVSGFTALDREAMAESVIKWARRKKIGSVYEDKILKVEVIDK